MNLIVEKTRKSDGFEILITPSREAFCVHGTRSVSSLFSFPEFQRRSRPHLVVGIEVTSPVMRRR